MARFPKKLQKKLARREAQNTFRHLPGAIDLVDFSSNDYLGFSRNRNIFDTAARWLSDRKMDRNGATGSRLLSGNHPLYSELEEKLADFHRTEAALVFNSGYDANIGFFGCVPQRGDVVFYDEYIHASIRDGIKMGNAKSYKFRHNDLPDLRKRCQTITGVPTRLEHGRSGGRAEIPLSGETEPGSLNRPPQRVEAPEVRSPSDPEVYIVTESVFSMDGDSPDLKALAEFCRSNGYHLIVDEAHAVGVFGARGEGLVQQLNLQDAVFARIVTFGKAMGCHGAAVLGSKILTYYLVNFARSLIYTTGLPPHSVATILSAYHCLSASEETGRIQNGEKLSKNIQFFNLELKILNLKSFFIPSNSAIHCCILPGNEEARAVSEIIRQKGFDVKAILSPTVPEGRERLRICLHSFNTKKEIRQLLELLSTAIKHP